MIDTGNSQGAIGCANVIACTLKRSPQMESHVVGEQRHDGDIKLDQVFCVGTGEWATEWERSVLGRNGQTLESDNAFIYRFEAGRIAEMWMFLGAQHELADRFFG